MSLGKPEKSESFFRVFAGIGAMSFLTYVGEYAAFIIVLVYLSDKLTVTFDLGATGYAFVGLISGAFLIASGLVAIYMGHLSDKYGRRRTMIAGCILGSVALLSLILADNLTSLAEFLVATAVALTALGLAHGTYTASTLAYGGDLAEKHQTMGKAYGLVDGAEFAGYAFGPAVGTTVAFLTSRTTVFEMSTSMLLISAVLAVLFMPEIRPGHVEAGPETDDASGHEEEEGPHFHGEDAELGHNEGGHSALGQDHSHSATWGDYVNAFRTPIVGVALLTTLVGAIGFSAFYSFVPLYAHTLQSQVPAFAYLYGYFGSLMAITGVLFMVPFGHYEDTTSRRMPYLVLGLIGGAAALALVFFTVSLPTFLVAALAFGLSVGMVRVSQLVILAEASKPTNRAAIMGTNHALEHVGYGTAAVMTGTLIAIFGSFGAAFRFLSVVLIVAGLAFLLYGRRAKVK
ncbi:MAG TPA: MFS transporter [Nitrososphaerales archaeon]|nr:MFS transporter [Nitrososphaerales archaeon]HUK74705.1 MFS transporter [Nitrososphaerales archaeon]